MWKLALLLIFVCPSVQAAPQQGQASWYSRASCKREGTSGIMANGKVLNDDAFTAASWDYALGTQLEVRNPQTRKSLRVTCTDRGPSRRLYRKGRILDLSQAAFQALAPLSQGLIEVMVEPVR